MTAVINATYIVLSLCLEHFRGFRVKQEFKFGKKKRNLVIFGRNTSGKTSFVDAFEFGLSPDRTIKRLSNTENECHREEEQCAIVNHRSDLEGRKASVQIVMGSHEGNDGKQFTINRINDGENEQKSVAHLEFLSKSPVLPIIRGEELLLFIQAWISTKRFEGIEKWKQYSKGFKSWSFYSSLLNAAKTKMTKAVDSQSEIITELVKLTNQKFTKWSEPAILNFINNELMVGFKPKFQMSKLDESDPNFLKLKEFVNSQTVHSEHIKKRNQQIRGTGFENLLNIVSQLLQLSDEFSTSKQEETELAKEIDGFEEILSSHSESMKSLVQKQIDQLHGPMNEYYQYIQGNPDHTIHLRLIDEENGQEGLNLAVDIATNRQGVLPDDYLTCAEKQSFALAFHLATIVELNPEAPIIILDDILLSYDAESRYRITALIVEKFSDHQFIITTCDRPFYDILMGRVDLEKWKFKEIIGFNENYGPIFSDFKSTVSQIQDQWGRGLSALWLIRLYLEQYFRKLAKDLKLKLPYLEGSIKSNYALNDLIEGFQEFTKKNNIVIPRLKAIDVDTLDFIRNLKMENYGSHEQEEGSAPYSITDEKERWGEIQEFIALMTCKFCKEDKGFLSKIGQVEVENKNQDETKEFASGAKQDARQNQPKQKIKGEALKNTLICKKCDRPLVFIENETEKKSVS